MAWEAHPTLGIEIVHLDKKTSFTHDLNFRDLESFFIDGLEVSSTKSKAGKKRISFKMKAQKSRLARIVETLNQRRSHCVGIDAEENNS